jgi:hypothetical protein
MRSSITPKAPVAIPWQRFSTPIGQRLNDYSDEASGAGTPRREPVDDDVSQKSDGLDETEEPETPCQADALGGKAAQERAGDHGDQADRRRREAHILRHVALLDEEGPDERGREILSELVQHQKTENRKRARAPEQVDQGIEHGLAERARRRHGDLGLRRPQDDAGEGNEQQREGGEDGRPSQSLARRDRDGPREQHGRARKRVSGAHRQPLLGSFQDLDRVGVDHDVLRGRAERHEQSQNRDDADVGIREGGEPEDREHQEELADQDPGAAAAHGADPRAEAVHQRRPQELEAPGRLGQREQPDRPDVDAPVGQERRQRDPDESQRQARGKRLEGDGADPPGGERSLQAPDRPDALPARHRRQCTIFAPC